jgi:phage shock protein C
MTDRLHRSRDDRMLAGVAGGLADYWDADPSLIRIIWALLVIPTGGVALVVYVVMAIVVPEEGDARFTAPGDPPIATASTPPPATGATTSEPTTDAYPPDPREARRAAKAARRAERRANRSNSGPVLFGAFLVILGGFFLVREWWPQIDFDWVWPAVLIVLGIVVLIASIRRDQGEHRNEDRGGMP